ncbi:MAG: pyridoxamine 5'-phosphate oxidase family protein, partial [Microbacteriaceae bacterium]
MSNTTPTRMPELMSNNREALNALLDSTIVGHVAYVDENGAPGVLPPAAARSGDFLIAHGSTGSR